MGQAYMEEALGGSRSRHLPVVCLTCRAHRFCTKYLLPACLLPLVVALGCASPTSSTTLCHDYGLLSPPPELSVTNPKSPSIILLFLLRLPRQTGLLSFFLSINQSLHFPLLSSLSASPPLQELPDLGPCAPFSRESKL